MLTTFIWLASNPVTYDLYTWMFTSGHKEEISNVHGHENKLVPLCNVYRMCDLPATSSAIA
jgi:hypothetical protein